MTEAELTGMVLASAVLTMRWGKIGICAQSKRSRHIHFHNPQAPIQELR